MVYLDHAATAPVPQAVAQAVYKSLTENFGNPSSQYAPGRRAAQQLEQDRAVIAEALGCRPQRLFFTSCGSEGDNWAIRCALWQNRHKGRHIITTAVEHSAVLETCRQLQRQGYEVTYLSPDRRGRITVQQVTDALREDTALVSMMLVNNETGNLYPVADVGQLLRQRHSATLLHCDAVQAFLEIPFSAESLGADFITISGHKIGAPKGIGALYITNRLSQPQPLIFGGGQEQGLRSGTEATAQIAGFARAAALRHASAAEDQEHMRTIQSYAQEQLNTLGAVMLGSADAPHILAFSLPGYPSQNVITELSSQEIFLSAGSACHKGQPSHVFKAMGLDKKIAAGALRISFGPETSKGDIDQLCQALQAHLRQRFPML